MSGFPHLQCYMLCFCRKVATIFYCVVVDAQRVEEEGSMNSSYSPFPTKNKFLGMNLPYRVKLIFSFSTQRCSYIEGKDLLYQIKVGRVSTYFFFQITVSANIHSLLGHVQHDRKYPILA